jgi:GT2 family glycosyltransferase
MSKKISIVIVTYNSQLHIFDCLSSIYQFNDIGDELEVIIVDNMSENVDEMFSSIRNKFGSRILLIKNTKNGGYGQGNNIGIKSASGSIIMIMNPDVRLLMPVFLKALCYFSSPKTIMLGMKQMISPIKGGLSFMVKLNSHAIFSVFETVLFNKLQVYIPNRMFFSGSCFFIRKDTFMKIGLFDEDVFMYGEENDLHNRLLKLNATKGLVYDKNLKYLHLVENRPPSLKEAIETLNSSIIFCDKNSMDKKKIILREIKRAKFFKIVEFIRGNNHKVKYYNELVGELSLYLKKVII